MRSLDYVLVFMHASITTLAVVLVRRYGRLAFDSWQQNPIGAPVVFCGLGAGLYVMSFLLWMFILSRNELSTVYPITTGLTLAATTVGAAALLNEPLTSLKIVGIGIIFLGVVVVTRAQ